METLRHGPNRGSCDMERDGRHSSDSDTVAAPGPTSFLHPSKDARRHHRNTVKLEDQEKGLVNWGKPNRGLIIAATDLNCGDRSQLWRHTHRMRYWAAEGHQRQRMGQYKQQKQEREGQQPALNSCPKTRSRGDAAQFFCVHILLAICSPMGRGAHQTKGKTKGIIGGCVILSIKCYKRTLGQRATSYKKRRATRKYGYRRERPNKRDTEVVRQSKG